MKTWKSNLEETKQRYINWWNHKGIILNMWEHFQHWQKICRKSGSTLNGELNIWTGT